MGECIKCIEMGNGLYDQGELSTGKVDEYEHFNLIGMFCFASIQNHPSPNELYVQVGDGEIDHNFWGTLRFIVRSTNNNNNNNTQKLILAQLA